MLTTKDSLDFLRQRTEERYLAALAALDLISDYIFDGGAVAPHVLRLRHGGKPSIRQLVLGAIANHAKTVEDIQTTTGLGVRKIRGVLNATDLVKSISRGRAVDGRVTYSVASQEGVAGAI